MTATPFCVNKNLYIYIYCEGFLIVDIFHGYFYCSHHLLYVVCPVFEFCTSFSGLVQVFEVVCDVVLVLSLIFGLPL